MDDNQTDPIPMRESRGEVMRRTDLRLQEAAAIFAEVYRARYENDPSAPMDYYADSAFRDLAQKIREYCDFNPFTVIHNRPHMGVTH